MVAALAAMALALVGCQSFRDAAGMTKKLAGRIRRGDQGAADHPAGLQSEAAEAGRRADQPDLARPQPPKPRSSAPIPARSPAPCRPTTARAKSSCSPMPARRMPIDIIRQQIAADNKSMQATDDSFTNSCCSASPAITAPARRSMPMPSRSGWTRPRRTAPARAGTTDSATIQKGQRRLARWHFLGSRLGRGTDRGAAIWPPAFRVRRRSSPRASRLRRRRRSARRTGQADQPKPRKVFQFALQNGMQVRGRARSPRARRHADAVVQGRRGGRSAGPFGPRPFLRAHDVPRHQDGAGRRVLADRRAQWRPGQRLHHP